MVQTILLKRQAYARPFDGAAAACLHVPFSISVYQHVSICPFIKDFVTTSTRYHYILSCARIIWGQRYLSIRSFTDLLELDLYQSKIDPNHRESPAQLQRPAFRQESLDAGEDSLRDNDDDNDMATKSSSL